MPEQTLDYPDKLRAYFFKMNFEIVLLQQRVEEEWEEYLHTRRLKLELIADRVSPDTQGFMKAISRKLRQS